MAGRGSDPRYNEELSRRFDGGAWAHSTFGSDRSDVIGITREDRSIEIQMRRYGRCLCSPQWNDVVHVCKWEA